MKCTVTVKHLQTSDHRFCAISALISAASPEKMDRYTKLRTTSGTMNIHQQSSPLGDHKYRGMGCHVLEENSLLDNNFSSKSSTKE